MEDPAYATIQRCVEAAKAWTAGSDLRELWKEQKGRSFPTAAGFRATVDINGVAVEGIFVEAYFKQSRIPGARDKLSVSLIVNATRALAVDDGEPSRHVNTVGVGRPYYLQVIDHPQLHLCSSDALEGYAEPLEKMPLDELWTEFMRRANIAGAPPFVLPTGQLELLS